jgi:hypothetical protein
MVISYCSQTIKHKAIYRFCVPAMESYIATKKVPLITAVYFSKIYYHSKFLGCTSNHFITKQKNKFKGTCLTEITEKYQKCLHYSWQTADI